MPQQIELRNIALQAAQPLVHGVSLTLQRGRVLALVGGSGSGKSLTCAATLGILPAGVRQTAGEILADGKPVSPCALRGIKIATKGGSKLAILLGPGRPKSRLPG